MSVDQDESSVHSSDGAEHNGEVSEDQGVEEVEVDESAAHKEPDLSLVTTFGGLLPNGTGTDVEGYVAVNRGLNKFVQPKHFASMLFSAHLGKMPWYATSAGYDRILMADIVISTQVPQKVMCNSVFVVDLKNLESESAIFRDGLGSWIQNCGKVANFFIWENDDVKEIKNNTINEQGVEFVRRIDKNASCSAYTRVTVISAQLGLAALQYFFKGEDEQIFEISYHRPKKTNSLISQAAAAQPVRVRGLKRKYFGASDYEPLPPSTPSLITSSVPRINGQIRSSLPSITVSTSPPMVSRITGLNKDTVELSAGTLVAYLREHIKTERESAVEDRQLRREETDLRRRENQEERQLRRDELELRKQELQLQNTRLLLEQQKWDAERKEKEIMFEILKKKLIEK